MSRTELLFGNFYDPQIVEEPLPEILDKFNAAFAQHQNFVAVTDGETGGRVVISITDVIKMREVD